MSIKIGSTSISNIQIGSNQLQSVKVGTTTVWEARDPFIYVPFYCPLYVAYGDDGPPYYCTTFYVTFEISGPPANGEFSSDKYYEGMELTETQATSFINATDDAGHPAYPSTTLHSAQNYINNINSVSISTSSSTYDATITDKSNTYTITYDMGLHMRLTKSYTVKFTSPSTSTPTGYLQNGYVNPMESSSCNPLDLPTCCFKVPYTCSDMHIKDVDDSYVSLTGSFAHVCADSIWVSPGTTYDSYTMDDKSWSWTREGYIYLNEDLVFYVSSMGTISYPLSAINIYLS